MAMPLSLLATPAAAQTFPSKPIRFVVPFAAGGPADTIGRTFGEKFSALVGQPVVIENRGGAGGMTGVAAVAKSEPDGHTLAIATAGTLALNVVLQTKMPYDPLKDLTLLTQAVAVPELLVVGAKVPANSVKELVALAKSQPGKITFASSGNGSMPHLASELLKVSAGLDIAHVPYKGAAPAVGDIIGGHVQMMFADIPVLLGNVQAGKLRALAVGSSKRAPSLPDVPTTGEAGFPQVLAENWYGIVAPANLPAAVAAKLHPLVVSALKSDEVTTKLAKQGAIVVASSTADFSAYVRSEIERWSKIAKSAGMKLK
jgi:tripartite-type tricarboxylate transporter receptor subunit TctC